jgi:aldehyde:ferredoxin oxidoreductase
MTWGNHKSIIAMTEKLAERQGFGDIIADGVKVAAKRIGKDTAKYAMHIQGQEVAAHDPKHDYHWGIAYKLAPTPGRHTQSAAVFRPRVYHPGELVSELDQESLASIGKEYRIGNALNHVMNSAGMCAFIFSCLPSESALAEFISAVTGWDVTVEELIKTGERILNIRQAFNIRQGLNTIEFKVPGRVYGNPPQKAGPLVGKTFDEKTLLTACIIEAGWDPKTAKPSKERLLELGLEDVARELWP